MQETVHTKNHEVAGIIASICGVSDRYVRMVINGECENEEVMTAYMTYVEEKCQIIKKVQELVPFKPTKNPSH